MHVEEGSVVLVCVAALLGMAVTIDSTWIPEFLLEPDSVVAAQSGRCSRCGIIEAAQEVDGATLLAGVIAGSLPGDQAAVRGARSYRAQKLTVRMEDGSLRTHYQLGLAGSVGQRVKVVHGALARTDS